MSDPESRGSECDGCEEVSRELVVACGDSSEVFELVEVSLDQVALAIDLSFDDAADSVVALGGDVCGCAGRLDQSDDRRGKIAPIGDHVARQFQALDKGRKAGLVGGLTGCDQEADRKTMAIHDDVDFRAQTTSRSSDGVIRAPFFPPAACWWARTIEESMR